MTNSPLRTAKHQDEALTSERLMELLRQEGRHNAETLDNLKRGCDLVEQSGQIIRPANVGRIIATFPQGPNGRRAGPNAQSIANSKETLRKYVTLREHERVLRSGGSRALGRGLGRVVPPIADETVRAYVEVLEVKVENLTTEVQLLRAAFARMSPQKARDVLGALKAENDAAAASDILRETSGPLLDQEEVNAIRLFLDLRHLHRFRLRIEDGEIITQSEATLLPRAGVTLLRRLVASASRDGGTGGGGREDGDMKV